MTPVARTDSRNSKLRLYRRSTRSLRSASDSIGSLPDVLRAFRDVTGWSLRYVPGVPSASPCDLACGHLKLTAPEEKLAVTGKVAEHPAALPADKAGKLAGALAGMVGELEDTRRALREREAELAVAVPLVPHTDEARQLADRLEAVLRGGAEAVGCHAAALYLLDDGTSQLKLRARWGLPIERLAAPPRPLQGAVADLEALLGHAVVLEDTGALRQWRVPEDFPAAVCVPVSTPTTILGTLWVFCQQRRDFNERETNILEITAGRIAAELEREILLGEGLDGARVKKQLAAAERLQRNQLPAIPPLLDAWDLCGWTAQGGTLGGAFHDWFALPEGRIGLAVGHALQHGVDAAMTASALRAALRAHAQYHRDAGPTINRVNLTLWTGSAGDQQATLAYGLLETATGRLSGALAGGPSVLVVRPDGWQSLGHAAPRLGDGPQPDFQTIEHVVRPGEAIVLMTEGVRDALDAEGYPLGENGVGETLIGHLESSAEALVRRLRRHLEKRGSRDGDADRALLVLKRK
jgi:phosphoserine phosphatase RsbU/P